MPMVSNIAVYALRYMSHIVIHSRLSPYRYFEEITNATSQQTLFCIRAHMHTIRYIIFREKVARINPVPIVHGRQRIYFRLEEGRR